MYFTGLKAGILFVAGASAAVLRSAVQARNGNNLNLQPSLADYGNFQRVMASPPGEAHPTGAPIRDFISVIYVSFPPRRAIGNGCFSSLIVDVLPQVRPL